MIRSWVGSLRIRLFLTTVLGIIVALAVGVAAGHVVLTRSLSADADSVAQTRAEAELGLVVVEGNEVRVGGDPDASRISSAAWVFQGERVIAAPRAGASVASGAESLAQGPPGLVDGSDQDTRYFVQPILSDGARIGAVVAAVSLAPYKRTADLALLVTSVAALVVLMGAAGLAWWTLGRAFSPVERMRATAERWSAEEPAGRRFAAGDPVDEISRLAQTLDQMLDRIDASIRRERRLSAEVSHELRTPLAAMAAEVELALRRDRPSDELRESLLIVGTQISRLGETIEALLASARSESGSAGACSFGDALDSALAGLPSSSRARVVLLDEEGRAQRVGVEPALLARALAPLIDNALRHGDDSVEIHVEPRAGRVQISVTDHGAGIAPEHAEWVFEPGTSLAADGSGAGLGLPLARRLARAGGGDITARQGPPGAFVIDLPAG